MALAIRVLAVDGRFANESDGDTNGSEEKGLAAADSIQDENDEDEIGQGTDAVVYSCDEQIPVTSDTKSLVHDGLVVANNIWKS